MPKFTNQGGPVKIRIGEPSNCYWTTIRKGESVELDLDVGRSLGFKLKTTEGQLGDQKVETKQIETAYTNDSYFFNELLSIKGIGSKTAEDIVDWGTKEKLIEVIKLKGALPFRDDVELKLREKYGK